MKKYSNRMMLQYRKLYENKTTTRISTKNIYKYAENILSEQVGKAVSLFSIFKLICFKEMMVDLMKIESVRFLPHISQSY